MTVSSCESRATDTTKTFTGESSLTGSIVQAWTATTGILLNKRKTKQKKNRRFIGKYIAPTLRIHGFSFVKLFFDTFELRNIRIIYGMYYLDSKIGESWFILKVRCKLIFSCSIVQLAFVFSSF